MANYDAVIELAKAKRAEDSIATASLNLSVIRRIYKAEAIKIDKWSFGSKIRAVYMFEDGDASVAINDKLPRVPALFSLVHELKHHFLDRDLIQNGELRCGSYNANQAVEVAAEVFAAEFIYPEREFLECVNAMEIPPNAWTAEDVVRLKRNCGALVSYQFLSKRLQRLGFVAQGGFAKIQFQKLEEQMFGIPIYKTDWFKAKRKR